MSKLQFECSLQLPIADNVAFLIDYCCESLFSGSQFDQNRVTLADHCAHRSQVELCAPPKVLRAVQSVINP